MYYTTLIDAETLAGHLNSSWRVFDCRFALGDPSAGERAYAAGHIPGAHYLHLDRDLASAVTAASGRHPLPEPKTLAAKLAAVGVGAGTQVVAYDDAAGAFAARLWWLLRWLGHPQVAVLDGGWKLWLREARPVSHEQPASAAPGDFRARPDDRMWLSSERVRQRAGAGIGRLLDARAAERFRGEQEPIDAVAGHVPGAVNLPYLGNISGDGRFKSAEALRTRFMAALDGAAPAETVCMCGSGVTACHNLLAMEVVGLSGGRLYAGSWSEWIRDPSRPVARGA